jgi:hypothetical protein
MFCPINKITPPRIALGRKRIHFRLIQARGQTCQCVEATDRDASVRGIWRVSRKWIAEASPSSVWNRAAYHPRSRTASCAAWSTLRSRSKRRWREKGRRALRCRRPARDASPKKEGGQFLDLQICRIDCLLCHRENVLPTMKFRFLRKILCSSRFAGRHFHNYRLVLHQIEPLG